MYRITQDSVIMSSHKDCGRIQDAYTLRCSPQVHGASRDAVRHVRRVVEIELDSATTNPLIFAETGEFLLGGNFHGQPLALAADYLCMAAAELANISERRIERLVNPQLSGLPAFLVNDSGLNSGFMIAQYTAAALVSENKVLSHPACVDSIPTSANKEDHVSMGTISARKCRSIIAERGVGDRHRAALRLPGGGPPHKGKAGQRHGGRVQDLPGKDPGPGPGQGAVPRHRDDAGARLERGNHPQGGGKGRPAGLRLPGRFMTGSSR